MRFKSSGLDTTASITAWEKLGTLEQEVMLLTLHHMSDEQIALELFSRPAKIEAIRKRVTLALAPLVPVLETYLQYVTPETWEVVQPRRVSYTMMDAISGFTENERMVAEWMASGKMTVDIHSNAAYVENGMVAQCRHVMEKLEISSRKQLRYVLDVHEHIKLRETDCLPLINVGELLENNAPRL